MDTAAQLVGCGQNPEDIVFASDMVLHFGKLLEGGCIALVEDRRCKDGFAVVIGAFMLLYASYSTLKVISAVFSVEVKVGLANW